MKSFEQQSSSKENYRSRIDALFGDRSNFSFILSGFNASDIKGAFDEAEDIDDIIYAIDAFNSAPRSISYEYRSASKVFIADTMVQLIVRSDKNAADCVDLLDILSKDPTQTEKDKKTKLAHSFESALRRYLQASPDLSRDEQDRILKLLWSLEYKNLLMDELSSASVIGSPALLQIPQIAELLTYRLTQKQVEVKPSDERSSKWLAMNTLRLLLNRYSEDDTRHAQNTAVIINKLFPSTIREGSFSRDNLISLANSILVSKNKAGSKELLLKNESGVVAPALEIVLSVTSASHVDDEKYEIQRYEDKLYANLIGMLLEQRCYARK